MFNLFDGRDGVHRTLLDKVDGYNYSSSANEHIRIIAQTTERLCCELGYETLDKPTYISPDYGFADYRIFKNYVFDEETFPIEKLSYFELLFRETEKHLLSEISFLKGSLPKYAARSEEVIRRSVATGTNFYNDGDERLKKAAPQLEAKQNTLQDLRTTIDQRLKLHKIPLSYHQGYFQQASDSVIERIIEEPFWALLDAPKYESVKTDMLEALDRQTSSARDPALYAAKALESMIKIVCNEKGFTTGRESGAAHFITNLNSKQNGAIINNEERSELEAMFKTRNTQAHGSGDAPMTALNDQQTQRYIHSAMAWIYSLSKR